MIVQMEYSHGRMRIGKEQYSTAYWAEWLHWWVPKEQRTKKKKKKKKGKRYVTLD